ncbi:MAG: hypothetical protein ACXW2E_00310 [Nitrososphaeraceae archaeon]
MGRLKKPENETESDAITRRAKERIANKSTRNEKISWDRKMNNMVSLLANLTPIEEQIIELTAQKIKIYDDIQQLRTVMVADCVHPFTHLEVKDDHVICKFCEHKFSISL